MRVHEILSEGEVVSMTDFKKKAELAKPPPGQYSDFRIGDWVRLQNSNPQTGKIFGYVGSGMERDFFNVRFESGEEKIVSNVKLHRVVPPKTA